MTAAELFTESINARIVAAVQAAELRTSGEIRVFVEDRTTGLEPLARAWQHFQALHMHETAARNGVLIYLAVQDRKFAIVGDEGINQHVPEHFWEEVRDAMRQHFRQGEFAEGIAEAVMRTGKLLGQYFPRQADDQNELPDDVIVR